MSIFHTHKFGPEQDRKQCCKECGLIVVVPCVHKWKVIGTRDPYVVIQCEICGEVTER